MTETENRFSLDATVARRKRWDIHWIKMAVLHAGMSKNPRTQVGAVVIGPSREVRTMGFNGFPRGIADYRNRLDDQAFCDECMIHAECNAIDLAAKVGIPLAGCTLFLAATDSTGLVWGGAPCVSCAMAVIQAGIKETVSFPFKEGPSRWSDSVKRAEALLQEAGIMHRTVKP